MLVIIIIGGFVIYCVIVGIYQYITQPKPPRFKNYREYYNYYSHNDITDESETDESEKLKIEKEIDFYTAQIAMLEDLQRLIENDLHNYNGNEKANLSRLISIDKQIHTAQKKIEKLNNELESL